MDGIASDKVNINLGEGGGGGSMAALVAALGNRNQGDNTAALIAALGNRNDNHRGDDGFGLGGGGILGTIALLGLLRGRGGFGGDDDCGNGNGGKFAILQTLMENGADLRAAIPTAALETQKEVCAASATITDRINQSQIASLAAFSNLKDAVTNTGTILLGASNQNTKEILGAICALGSKIDQNQILDLQRQLGVAQADAREERGHRHSDGVEVRVSQQVNQAQAQLQFQTQQQRLDDERFGRLFGLIANIGNQVQRSNQGMDVVNFGSGSIAGSGLQSTANNQVR